MSAKAMLPVRASLTVAVSIFCAATLSAAATTSTDLAQVAESIRKQHDLPALALVVVKDGAIRDRVAVGVRKAGDSTQVTPNDVFHIGSCTKSMTATLAALLVEEGTLRWATTIADVLPELKGNMNTEYQDVTLEQLLAHRGGVPGEPPEAAWKRAWEEKGTPAEQRREFIEAVLKEAPTAPPGTKTAYSNQGYAIAGAMLERITGTPWERLIAERLFKPLGMDSGGFGPPGKHGELDQPWGHVRDGSINRPSQLDNPPAIAPAGRVHCSLDDLAGYAIFHLGRGQGGGLLKPESLTRLHTPLEGGDYALGWVVAERRWAGGKTLSHAGSNTMWYVVMWLAPEKNFAVIVATNVGSSGAARGCDEAAGAAIRQWLGN